MLTNIDDVQLHIANIFALPHLFLTTSLVWVTLFSIISTSLSVMGDLIWMCLDLPITVSVLH